jgi:hypothetical protein
MIFMNKFKKKPRVKKKQRVRPYNLQALPF